MKKTAVTRKGIVVSEIAEGGQVIEKFADRLRGRYPVRDILDEQGNVLISKDHMMMDEDAKLLEAHGIHEVKIRTVLTCHAHSGVCAKCYGMNLATGQPRRPRRSGGHHRGTVHR